MIEENRSITDVLQDILQNVQTIVRAEVSLAKAELRDDAARSLASLTRLIAGGVCAALAATFLLWTIAYALALVWPIWAATLLVGVVLAIGAGVLISSGVRHFRVSSPQATVESMKENVAWPKQSVR
jgi:uncharacterized membrane protein YqjE